MTSYRRGYQPTAAFARSAGLSVQGEHEVRRALSRHLGVAKPTSQIQTLEASAGSDSSLDPIGTHSTGGAAVPTGSSLTTAGEQDPLL
jgi:hypothetical protein